LTQATSNSDRRIVEAIKRAIDLHANGQTELAVQLLSALIAELPSEPKLHTYLAAFLWRTGRFDDAIEPARQAITLLPQSERASLMLFHLLWKTGKRIEALDEMKRFLSVNASEEYSRMIKEWELSEGDEPALD
jgi:predicted Zn-dependent protease